MSTATTTLKTSSSPCQRAHDLIVERYVAEGVLVGSVVGLLATVLAYLIFQVSIGPVALPAGVVLFVTAYLRLARRSSRRSRAVRS